MGHQIVKQPNGLYAVWSSNVDDFIMVDCTAEDIIQDRIEKSSKEIREGVEKTISELEKGKKPYYQFTKSFEECVHWITRYGEGPNAESLQLLEIADPNSTMKRLECSKCEVESYMDDIGKGQYRCDNCGTINIAEEEHGTTTDTH